MSNECHLASSMLNALHTRYGVGSSLEELRARSYVSRSSACARTYNSQIEVKAEITRANPPAATADAAAIITAGFGLDDQESSRCDLARCLARQCLTRGTAKSRALSEKGMGYPPVSLILIVVFVTVSFAAAAAVIAGISWHPLATHCSAGFSVQPLL